MYGEGQQMPTDWYHIDDFDEYMVAELFHDDISELINNGRFDDQVLERAEQALKQKFNGV